jgi:hypothetical protein
LQALVADASYNLAKRDPRRQIIISDFAKIADGTIPLNRSGLSGTMKCYAAVHTRSSPHEGVVWAVTANPNERTMDILFGGFPILKLNKRLMTTPQTPSTWLHCTPLFDHQPKH